MNIAGLILSNLHRNRLPEMSRRRSLSSVPFGCRYRLIDFPLSNMVNAGITNIGIATDFNYRSLLDLVCSVGDTFVISVPALLALIPAAGIVPGIEYMELFGYFGVSGEDVDVFADILYSIPFLYIILLRMLERDRK